MHITISMFKTVQQKDSGVFLLRLRIDTHHDLHQGDMHHLSGSIFSVRYGTFVDSGFPLQWKFCASNILITRSVKCGPKSP